MSSARARVQIAALVRTWLVLDFFGDSRRAGNEQGSSLTTTIMWQSLLAFLFALLLYPDTAPVPFVAANLSLATMLVAIGTLGDDDRPLRRLADQNVLAGAPITRTSIVLARAAHAAFQLGLVTIGMALPPALLLGHLTGDWLQTPAYVLAAIACTGLATGTLATARSLLARLLGQARAALLMGTLKAALLGGGFVLFALSLRALGGTADDLPITRAGAELLPPYHAARLLALPGAEAWRLLPWAVVGLLLVLATIALTAADSPGAARVGRRHPLRALLRRLCGGGPRLGVADFVATTMWRSAGFRARVLPLFGLPAGMVFLTLAGDGAEEGGYVLLALLLQLPAIYLPFLIAFLPRADQADTAWVFDHAPGLTRGLVDDATWRALVTHVLLPIHGVALVLVVALGPDRGDRAAAALFAFALAVLAAGPMTRLDRVPFTDDREEERGLDLGALMAGALLLGGLGAAFGALLPPAMRWPAAAAALAFAGARLARRPRSDPGQALATAGDEPPAEPAAPLDDAAHPVSEPVDTQAAPRAGEAGLGRELRAVAVLYGLLSVLPWLAGAAFAP